MEAARTTLPLLNDDVLLAPDVAPTELMFLVATAFDLLCNPPPTGTVECIDASWKATVHKRKKSEAQLMMMTMMKQMLVIY
jgi:glucose dehydrogenase